MEMHVFWGLMIPVAFLGFTGLVKSIVKKEMLWSNFYLGIDIALAALANAVVNIVDGAHQIEMHTVSPSDIASQMLYTSLCILASIGVLLGAMALHQRFEEEADREGLDKNRLKRGIWLGIVGNLMGGSVLAMFIYMKLRRLV